MPDSRRRAWTLAIVCVGLFMVVLDNLVVSVALPSIHRDLGASIQSLEWTVNAYTLSYAVFLLTGSALGDRLGRKQMFMFGIGLFTLSSAAAALAPSTGTLIAARAVQGFGAAIATPLTLTLLADAFPPARRGVAIGVWSAVSGIAVALGPLVGGAVVQAASWHWIFWINVPIGLVLVPLAGARLVESRGPNATLDLGGLTLASTGLFGIVYGLVRSQSLGWTSPTVLIALIAGAVLVAAFIVYERRVEAPMLPMSFFAQRSFAVTNVVSLAMYFGMFGSIFFLSQFLQNVLHNSPLQAGVKLLVWTGATMVVSPLAGFFSERLGSRLFMAAGLGLQAVALGWLATLTSVDADVHEHDRTLHPRRSRHGSRIRPGRQRRPVVGPHRSGRPGLGRHQRDPRAWRCARCLGAGHHLHQSRRLRLTAGVRKRPDPRDVGRNGRARGRRPDRSGAPVQHPGDGRGPGRARPRPHPRHGLS